MSSERDRLAAIMLPLLPGDVFIGVIRRNELAYNIADELIAAGFVTAHQDSLCGPILVNEWCTCGHHSHLHVSDPSGCNGSPCGECACGEFEIPLKDGDHCNRCGSTNTKAMQSGLVCGDCGCGT